MASDTRHTVTKLLVRAAPTSASSGTGSREAPSGSTHHPTAPTASRAATLKAFSKAMATTSPGCRSRVAAWRAPKRVAKRSMPAQKRAPMATGLVPGTSACAEWATARTCTARYGSMPSSMVTVTSTPSAWLR
jgi:hypothetical protein